MEAQEFAAEADAARDGLRQQVSALEEANAANIEEIAKLKKKNKRERKERFKAEEDMKDANRRAIEVEEVLAEKVRQLGERIFQSHAIENGMTASAHRASAVAAAKPVIHASAQLKRCTWPGTFCGNRCGWRR